MPNKMIHRMKVCMRQILHVFLVAHLKKQIRLLQFLQKLE